MSPQLKRGLIIGGIVLGTLVVCVIVAFAVVLPQMRGGVAASYAPEYAEEYGVGGGYADEEFAAEAPAAPMEEEALVERVAVPTMAAQDITGDQTVQPIERLIIRNGSISMTVEDTRAAKAAIEQMVAGMSAEGAFVVSSNESASGVDTSPYINMSIRVPATRFDEAMDQLAALAVPGTSPTISESAQDVTEEYVDIQARVESLEAARDRLVELMRSAQTTEDLLMAEQQLTQREAEIEALKGRMRYLSESARLSRIDISLSPYILSQPVDTRWRPAETVREAFNALVNSLRGFGDFLIFFAIAALPWLLLAGLVIYAVVRVVIWRVRIGQQRRAAANARVGEES